MSNLLKLKYQISSIIVRHIADKEGITPSEYGEVYDSEKHEQMLEAIMSEIRDEYHPGANEKLKRAGI